MNGESHEECEFRIYNSEGELCWMYAIFTSRYNIIGQIIGVLVQCTDLTERKKTELCLLASERKYRELADSGETLIMKLDLDFNCIYINEIGSVFIGYNSEDLVGTDPLECDEILDKTIYKEKLQEVVDTQQPLTFICEIEHISGAQRWLRNSLTPLYDDHGVLNGILHQAVDITDQKEIELALSLSESQFKDLANIGDIQVYVLDIDGYFTYVNKPAESFCERDICGLHYRDVFDVYEMPYCDDIYSTHEKQIFDHIKYLPNDKYVWHHSTFLPRYNQNNEFIGVISQCIDVTERKNDALLLEKSEQEYRMLSNLGEIHILKYNKDRAYTYANSLVLDFWSKTENDVYGKSLQEVFELKETETFINAFQLQQSVTLECAFQCKGQNYYFRCYLTPLFDEKHQFNGMLEQRINITEQREAELKLKESESRYRDLANSGETYIAVFGTDKCCTYVNQQICGYLGRSEEELLGEYVDNFLPLNAEQKPEFGEMFINHSSKVFQIETMKYNGKTH